MRRIADFTRTSHGFSLGRVEDGRGNLGHSATPRFPSPLIGTERADLRHPALRLVFIAWTTTVQ
jgi:hypothetical protein